MAGVGILKQHRTWEDWAGIGLGVLIGLSPWIAEQTADQSVLLGSVALGLLVLLLAQLELVRLHWVLEAAQLVCGLALIALPFALGYAAGGTLGYWHIGLGALVALLALLELWQGRGATDGELPKQGRLHGQ